MIARLHLTWIALSLVILTGTGCGKTEPPRVSEILPAVDGSSLPPIAAKTQLGMSVEVSGAGPFEFRWSATRGEISDPSRPAILYTAPDTPGPVSVTVEVIGKGGSTLRTRDFNVGAPPSPPPPGDGLTLTNPKEGDQVPCQILAAGTYPPGLTEKIWPVVVVGGRYHPQDEGGRAPRMSDGRWRGTVRFGVCNQPDRDRGVPFTLMIVTANEKANQAFESYVKNAAPDFAGLDQLPEGADSKVEIGVVRK
ncbi:MAG TPA: hypothetical protein VEW48_05130 [Thermoanaerobaculia bacterium]|nr:hypothetical protein [Thermoanaerobaculia bacterium]